MLPEYVSALNTGLQTPALLRYLLHTPQTTDKPLSSSQQFYNIHRGAGTNMASNGASGAQTPQPQAQIQPCRYKTGKTLGAGSYSVVKECVHIDTGRYYAAKVINKRLMAGREHMVHATHW